SDTTVSDGTLYYYVVSAVNAFGESGNSNEVSGGCTYALSPTSVTVPAIGGSRSSSVTTGSSCGWTGSTPSGWISFTTGSGTGSGTLAFDVASNSGIVGRTATIMLANRTLTVVQAGAPAAGDLDGDGLGDLSVWHPGATGQWQNLFSVGNYTSSANYNLGTTGDQPLVADFDGDKKADLAVWRPSTGQWQYLHSNTNFTTTFTRNWGTNGDVPVPGDYDGDGKADLAVWRPSTGQWFVLQS